MGKASFSPDGVSKTHMPYGPNCPGKLAHPFSGRVHIGRGAVLTLWMAKRKFVYDELKHRGSLLQGFRSQQNLQRSIDLVKEAIGPTADPTFRIHSDFTDLCGACLIFGIPAEVKESNLLGK